MTDTFETLTGQSGNGEKAAVRVAYTLNNYQPVISTIIGDQPLFYMDYEDHIEEDSILEDEDLALLKKEIDELEREVETYERFSKQMEISAFDKMDAFATNFGEGEKLTLDSLLDHMSKSRTAKTYIEFAKEHGVEIVISDLFPSTYYDRVSKKIFVHSSLQLDDAILSLSQTLRQHWQHRQGALIDPMMFHPDNAILVNRAQHADLCVAMIRIAWELQLASEKSTWQALERSQLGDLARAFAREAFLDFRTLNNGTASTAVFEAWFLSERCRVFDKKLIQRMLSAQNVSLFGSQETAAHVTPELLAALGTQACGKNYLAPHISILMNDPIFTDVRDRSSANFLWFIKFERSFKETEQELQNDFGLAARGNRAGTNKTKKTDQNHVAEERGAEIISIFTQSPNKSQQPKRKASGDNRSAEIVYLRRWCSE